VLASGGLDSSVMLAELAKRGRHVFPVYIRAGLKWEKNELPVLRRYLEALGFGRIEPVAVLTMPFDDVAREHWSVTGKRVPGYGAAISSNYIPGRNLGLLAKAAIFCARNRIGEIAIAPLRDNPFPDARREFFRAFERSASLGLAMNLRVRFPFGELTKAQVIRRGAKFPLALTLSCARPSGSRHCGACTKCAERIAGFRIAGIEDPTRYVRAPR